MSSLMAETVGLSRANHQYIQVHQQMSKQYNIQIQNFSILVAVYPYRDTVDRTELVTTHHFV